MYFHICKKKYAASHYQVIFMFLVSFERLTSKFREFIPPALILNLTLNLNSLLVTRQMTLFHQGFGWGRNKSLERTSEANLDTQSPDISAVENRDSGRSLIVWGMKLHLNSSILIDGS